MSILYTDNDLDKILSSLANMKRRGIVHTLSLQPATIKELATLYDLSLPSIDKHITNLIGSNLIVRKKSGRTNFVALNQNTLGIAKKWIMQYETSWGNPNATLENYVSRMKQ